MLIKTDLIIIEFRQRKFQYGKYVINQFQLNMGGICCQQQQNREQAEQTLTISLSSVNQIFSSIQIQASNQPLTKQSIDLLITFTDETFDLNSVQLVNKLLLTERNTIKQFAKNTAHQSIPFAEQAETQRFLYKQDLHAPGVQKWQVVTLDNPIVRIDIASFLFVNTKIWNGTDGVTAILQQLFQKIKPKVDKVETVGIVEVSNQFGIPLKKFHNKLLQMFLDICKSRNKPKQQLIAKQDSQQQTNMEKVGKQQILDSNNKLVQEGCSRTNKLVYLSNSRKSLNLFSENLKQFQDEQTKHSFLNRSDYY